MLRALAIASRRRYLSGPGGRDIGYSRAVRVSIALGLAAALVAGEELALACPIGTVITVDNDTAGSGYSEVKPENWVSHDVDACQGSYRYLSHTVGDGTRIGQAIWTPNVPTSGTYDVVTSFRATVNRTDDADYVLYDDLGGQKHQSLSQKFEGGCTKVSLGSVYCAAGGSCRLVLDGDDGESAAADVTTFTLTGCDAPDASAPNPCDPIAAHAGWELCESSGSTCAGVYTDGAGCAAFCAAAGMQCTASFGGEPGCAKEPANPLPCDGAGHTSDWCECALPPQPDAGTPDATAASGGSGGQPDAGGWSGSSPADSAPGASPPGPAGEASGCACRSAAASHGAPWMALLALALLWTRRR
jgi:MYXO-CTERM domain-containing protein